MYGVSRVVRPHLRRRNGRIGLYQNLLSGALLVALVHQNTTLAIIYCTCWTLTMHQKLLVFSGTVLQKTMQKMSIFSTEKPFRCFHCKVFVWSSESQLNHLFPDLGVSERKNDVASNLEHSGILVLENPAPEPSESTGTFLCFPCKKVQCAM